MGPLGLFMMALLAPPVFALLLLVPPYLGCLGAVYLVYDTGASPHPLAGKWLDVFYILDAYGHLLTYWRHHMTEVSFVHMTLPVVGLPLLVLLLTLWGMWRLTRKVLNLFHLSTHY